jgi:putative phosphoesterase
VAGKPEEGGEQTVRTIGVISDTHGLLRKEALDALEGSRLILHAGDVGDPSILERLAEMAPVHAVHGNTDGGDLRRLLAPTVLVDLGAGDGSVGAAGAQGPLAYVLHDLADLDLDPAAAGIAMVVTGHTHEPSAEEREGVLYLNPGSAGPRRFRLPVTVAKVVIGGGKVEAEFLEIAG